MNIYLTFIILYILLVIVSLPFGLLFSHTNHIENVQHSRMNVNEKSFLSGMIVSILSVLSIYYVILKGNNTAYEAFYLGAFMTAYSEYTTSFLFVNYPFYVASIDTLIGGCVFACVTLIFKKLF